MVGSHPEVLDQRGRGKETPWKLLHGDSRTEIRVLLRGVRHGEELGGDPLVDPHKLGGIEGGRDPHCSTIGICQRRETLLLRFCIDS
ncbi:hypothetical protein Tco_0327279 [Tanacetum coccineum]